MEEKAVEVNTCLIEIVEDKPCGCNTIDYCLYVYLNFFVARVSS